MFPWVLYAVGVTLVVFFPGAIGLIGVVACVAAAILIVWGF